MCYYHLLCCDCVQSRLEFLFIAKYFDAVLNKKPLNMLSIKLIRD
jgi:hypothetical protein